MTVLTRCIIASICLLVLVLCECIYGEVYNICKNKHLSWCWEPKYIVVLCMLILLVSIVISIYSRESSSIVIGLLTGLITSSLLALLIEIGKNYSDNEKKYIILRQHFLIFYNYEKDIKQKTSSITDEGYSSIDVLLYARETMFPNEPKETFRGKKENLTKLVRQVLKTDKLEIQTTAYYAWDKIVAIVMTMEDIWISTLKMDNMKDYLNVEELKFTSDVREAILGFLSCMRPYFQERQKKLQKELEERPSNCEKTTPIMSSIADFGCRLSAYNYEQVNKMLYYIVNKKQTTELWQYIIEECFLNTVFFEYLMQNTLELEKIISAIVKYDVLISNRNCILQKWS